MSDRGPQTAFVVDASVWVSRLVPHDAHYHSSRRWLQEFTARGGRVVAPMLLLPEIAGAISRRSGASELGHEAAKQIQRVGTLRLVSLDQRLGEAATRLAADLELRGADATYVAVAEQLKIPLLTWDKEQIEKAGNLIAVRSPDDD